MSLAKPIYDAIVVGAGPNGLAAAITLARAKQRVLLIEGRAQLGGAATSAELTLPGFVHDLGSAVHPFGVASPFFRSLPLARYGLRWIYSPAVVAHPFDDGSAAILRRSVQATAASLGSDARAYTGLMRPIVRSWQRIMPTILNPFSLPRHPFALLRFGLPALLSARLLAQLCFREDKARGLFAGMSAHSLLPMEAPLSAAPGLVLSALGHAVGWPIPVGGTQALTNALAAYFRDLGGTVETEWPVRDLDELPPARAILCDISPKQLLKLAGNRLPESYQQRLRRFRHAPGIFKIDYALDGPIPWAAEGCDQAITVHLGATLEEISLSEQAPYRQEHATRPYVLLAQPSRFDQSRAPQGKHVLWAYCHLTAGSSNDMSTAIEDQIERFAPGFRQRILARSTMGPAELEASNPNLIGGDISGGLPDWRQIITRPVVSLNPYATPAPGLYLCSSSTPPGSGVHGMCGYHAARAALKVLES